MSKSVSLFLLALIGLMMAGCGGGGDKTAATHQISGTISSSGVGVQGISVTLGGAGNADTVTDLNGNYSFNGLANGTYTVTPAWKGHSCTPKANAQTVSGANITDVNFTAKVSSPVIYVVDNQKRLGTVDMTSGNVVVIGDTGVVMTDIAFDSNGNLYGISINQLFAIDKSSGISTAIGNLNLTDTTSLEFSNCGNILYTADRYLRTVHTTTGVTTRIGNTGFINYPSSGDLAFLGNRLYLTSRIVDDSTNTNLVKLSTLTGEGTPVGPVGFPNVFGLVSNDNINLYGFSNTNVIRIDVNTGAGSLLWDISGHGLGNINGAAYYYFEPA